ncbi:uncharacterized protein V6R79_019329 [Siganus canaliculatus]
MDVACLGCTNWARWGGGVSRYVSTRHGGCWSELPLGSGPVAVSVCGSIGTADLHVRLQQRQHGGVFTKLYPKTKRVPGAERASAGEDWRNTEWVRAAVEPAMGDPVTPGSCRPKRQML